MKRILTILGARPQFIKAAAVSRTMAEADDLEEIIVHTGQHFDHKMSDIFFEEMSIPQPNYNLEINSLSHGAMTGRMLEGVEEIIQKEKPDMVLVYGDTNSTVAGPLAARKLHVPCAHVEAGLRSYNERMPEEINRIIADRISNILFCPTDTAVKNLRDEGFDNLDIKIVKCGDVMYDAALHYSQLSAERSTVINKLGLDDSPFVLCTVHRQENTDDPQALSGIIEALNRINKEIPVVLPLHPRTRKVIERDGLGTDFNPIDPVGYFDMIELLKHCSLVMTDSGGLQKEAYFFKKNCVTMREQTEWVELLDGGFNTLAGSDSDRIYQGYETMLNKKSDFALNLYGDGHASEVIVTELSNS